MNGIAPLSHYQRPLSGRKLTVRFWLDSPKSGQSAGEAAPKDCGPFSNFDTLRQSQGIVDINAKIANRALNLAVAQEDLDCSKIT